MKEQPIVTLTIRAGSAATPKGRRTIAAWLRKESQASGTLWQGLRAALHRAVLGEVDLQTAMPVSDTEPMR